MQQFLKKDMNMVNGGLGTREKWKELGNTLSTIVKVFIFMPHFLLGAGHTISFVRSDSEPPRL